MTQEEIDHQIQIIREVGQELRGNREACRQFLIDAGIIAPDINLRQEEE